MAWTHRQNCKFSFIIFWENKKLIFDFSKKEWEGKAATAKENYEKEMRKFEANGGSVADTKKASKRGGGKAAAKSKAKKKPASSEEEEESE